jgi:hypothetical protein
MLRLNLGHYLKENGISACRLAREAGGKVPSGTVYSMARSPKRGIDLATVSELLNGLNRLTGKGVSIPDLLIRLPASEDES